MAAIPPSPSLPPGRVPNSSPSSSPPSFHPPSPSPPPPLVRPVPLTTMDYFTAALYPLTLLSGSIFSLLSPSDASITSYFSQKHNLFNILFVKRGWFWTTLVFLLHVSYLRRSSKPRALFRYALATIWWVFVTQWFFGPPIMDRTFTVTGGTCQAIAEDPSVRERMGAATAYVTSAACKVAGGRWSGGHDLSGHTFLLTHASLFLWSEVAPGLVAGGAWGAGQWGVVACLGVWWWMLLMTGVYFHTWREKLTGWVVSMVEWIVVYIWALKTQPELREAIGVPGI